MLHEMSLVFGSFAYAKQERMNCCMRNAVTGVKGLKLRLGKPARLPQLEQITRRASLLGEVYFPNLYREVGIEKGCFAVLGAYQQGESHDDIATFTANFSKPLGIVI